MAVGKHTWLASFYKRIRAKRGAKVAIKATAYKLAKLVNMVLTKGCENEFVREWGKGGAPVS